MGCQKGLRSQKEKFYMTTKNKAGFQEEISFKAHIKSQVKSGHVEMVRNILCVPRVRSQNRHAK